MKTKYISFILCFSMIQSLTVNAQNITAETNTLNTRTDTVISTPSSKALEIDPLANDEFILCREIQNISIYDNCANKFKLISLQNQKKYTIKSISNVSECNIEIEKDSSNKGVYFFIPEKSIAKIGRVGIFNNNTLVQEFNFNILKVPPVKILESSTNLPLDNLAKQGLNVNKSNSKLLLNAVSSDDNLKLLYPNDFRFIIKNAEVHLVSGRKSIKTIHAQNVIDLKDLFEIVRNDTTNAGYRLIIEATDVRRLNYKNQLINTSNPPLIYSIPLYKD